MRLVAATPILCTHCGEPLTPGNVGVRRCVNPECPLASVGAPDPAFGTEPDEDNDRV